MRKLAVLLSFVLVLAAGSCASLPDDCAPGQVVVKAANGWTCSDSVTDVPPHTHRVTEILTSCQRGQIVVWDGQANGWVCRDPAAHSHAPEEEFPTTYYTVEIAAGSEEDLATTEIEGHRFCALSESRTGPGGRCEVLRTTEGFSLQAWARPGTRTECGAVCF